jgi:3-hydroxyisobutyrate dehydrogenase
LSPLNSTLGPAKTLEASTRSSFIADKKRAKTASLISKGAIWCSSPKEVTEKADIIFTIVGYPVDVENVYLSDNGILSAAQPGKIFIDMTTTKPSLAQKIYLEAKKYSCMK